MIIGFSLSMRTEPISTYPAPRETLVSYPGKRPSGHFIVADEKVLVFDEVEELIEYYEQQFGKKWEELTPVLAYGSNANPGQLDFKFGLGCVVPVLLGSVTGVDVVYNLISNWGYAFADLLLNQEGVECPMAVTFLTDDQIELLKTDEQNYEFSPTPYPFTLPEGDTIDDTYFFAGKRKIWTYHGSPIAIKEIAAKGRVLPEMSQAETMKLIITEFQLEFDSVEVFAQVIIDQRLEPDTEGKLSFDLKQQVNDDAHSLPSVYEQLQQLR